MYSLDASTKIDVVLRFAYDPTVLTPAVIEVGLGGSSLTPTAGLAKAGEYWIRLSGTVPAGQGTIAVFPFLLAADAKVPENLGTVTLYSLEP